MSSDSSPLVAQYQNLVYGNDQLLLKQANCFDIVQNQQQFKMHCPRFVESMDSKDRFRVYGYIRLICQPLLPLAHIISTDITHLVLYYYCFTEEQYDGSIDEWTREELRTRYLPLKPLKYGPSTLIYQGKSTWYNEHKRIAFGAAVALKKVNCARNPQATLPLLREMRILRELFAYPFVINLHDVLPSIGPQKCESLTMIYEGMDADLGKIFCTNQYFSPLHVQYFLYNILLGVKYIHDAHIVHRNLRPSSILVNADCTVKIASFRTACGIEEATARYPHVGHRWYRAPETILLYHPSANQSDLSHLYLMDMWAVGCIFAELIQMLKSNCFTVVERRPLFPGDSCFPLTPKRSKTYGAIYRSNYDQLRVIFSGIGPPNNEDMEWLTDRQARDYVNDMIKDMEVNENTLNYNAADGGMSLLRNLLRFDIRKRFTAAEALESKYFDTVRVKEMENMAPPAVYSYPEMKKYGHKDTPKKEVFNQLLSEEISNYI